MKRALPLMIAFAALATGNAGVTRVEITRRLPVTVPGAGAYEDVRGTVHFAFDPANRYNSRIVDLDKAPRNEAGLVEASADFRVLRPASGGSRALWLEVSNRGGQASLRYFNAAGRDEPFGDGLLMRLGLTVAWVGWQWDVPRRDGLLRLSLPVATDGEEALQGLVRADWTVDQPAVSLGLGHRGHVHYPVVDPQDAANVLTVRDGRDAPRTVVSRDRWHFTDDSVVLQGGFEAGQIYELVYRARDPRPIGLGLAAIRDIASHAKGDSAGVFAAPRTMAFGVSQTGRFLRHYLYQGFNTDEDGRRALDGMLVHTAGAGRGSFNHRFGQASRDAHRYSAFFYPTDIFPFTGREQIDPVTGQRDGLLSHAFNANHIPRIFYTNTGYEYWGRAASLLHTSVDGTADIAPAPNVRIYHIAGAQHTAGGFPPSDSARLLPAWTFRNNTLNFLVTLRALAADLVEWVVDNRPPPPSAFPESIRALSSLSDRCGSLLLATSRQRA